MTRECQVCFGSAITNAGRTWHAQVPDVSPNPACGTKLTGFLLPCGYSQIGFCWLSATCQGTIKPFAYYKIWSAYLKSQVSCFFMKLRHCLLRLAPFLKNIKLCFYPLGDLLLLDKFLDNFCACDFSLHSLLQNGFKYSLSKSGMTKTLQAKSVSKSHHLSCWAKTAVGNIHATLCLLQPSSYLLGSQSMEFCTGQQTNVHIFCTSQGVAKKLERTWPTHFDTNKKRS